MSVKIFLKNLISVSLAFLIIISSGIYIEPVYGADIGPYIISPDGESEVKMYFNKDGVTTRYVILRGEGNIDRQKYIDGLKSLGVWFSELPDGTIKFYKDTVISIDGSGQIYAPEDCTDLFRGAYRVNLTDKFNTSKVKTMERMFCCVRDRTPLGGNFDTSNVTNFKDMFKGATNFDQALPAGFVTSNGVNFEGMFDGCKYFNRTLAGHLDTSKAVGSMDYMFRGMHKFNSPLGDNFYTGGITSMRYMFSDMESFNQPLGAKFDTSNVENMEGMFLTSKAFNQPDISNFDVSKAKNISKMFKNTNRLSNMNLSSWDTSHVEEMDEFISKYNSSIYKNFVILDEWEMDSCIKKSVTLTSNLKYNYIRVGATDADGTHTLVLKTYSYDQFRLITPKRKSVAPYGVLRDKANQGIFRLYQYYGGGTLNASNFDPADYKFEGVEQGTKLKDLTEALNAKIPAGRNYRLEFTELNDEVLNDIGNQQIEIEAFYTGTGKAKKPSLRRIQIGVVEKVKQKLDADFFNDVTFEAEKGQKLSDSVINKTNANYSFSWKDGAATTLDTLGEVDATIVCTPVDSNEWEALEVPVKVHVKDHIKIIDIQTISSNDISTVSDQDIVAKAVLDGAEISGSFTFAPALDSLSIENGDNEVTIKFTANPEQANAISNVVTAKLKLHYEKIRQKLEADFFNDVTFEAEKGQKLSDSVINKTNANYSFSWKDGAATTLDTLGEVDATIVCTPVDSNEWEALEVPVKVHVKDHIKIIDIQTISSNDISTVSDQDIVAKAVLDGAEISGSFTFAPALDSLSIENGDNEVTIKFTANPEQANAISNVVTAKLKLHYTKIKQKLEADFFNDVTFEAEKGQKLSDSVINKTNANYRFSWKDGAATTLDTLGEVDATIVCTPVDSDEWDALEIPVKVHVKDHIKIIDIQTISSNDISTVSDQDIVAKAVLDGAEISGSFTFAPALDSLNIQSGKRLVTIKFTANPEQANAISNVVTAKLKLHYEKIRQKLEADFFNDVTFEVEKGQKLSDVVIGKTNANYSFSWKDGAATTLDTVGEVDATVVCTPVDSDEWEALEIPVKVNVVYNKGTDDSTAEEQGPNGTESGNSITTGGGIVINTNKGTDEDNDKDNDKFETDDDDDDEDEDGIVDVDNSANGEEQKGQREDTENVLTSREQPNRAEDNETLVKQKLERQVAEIIDQTFNEEAQTATKDLLKNYLEYKENKASKANEVNQVNSASTETESVIGEQAPNHLVTKSGREIVDVQASDYYSDAVKFAIENNILKGTSENEYSPNEAMTNAMADTVIYRLSGFYEIIDDQVIALGVSDEWYANAVKWAEISKIIYQDENYSPEDKMSRQDFVLHLYRYCDRLGIIKDEASDAVLNKFTDKHVVSSKNKISMKWAVANGIIIGTNIETLEPKQNITRGQLALVIERFLNYLSENVADA